MNKLIIIGLALIATCSTTVNASTVNVLSSDGLFAGNSASNYSAVSLLTNSQIASNLSDNDAATYLFGSSNNGTTTANLTLSFQNAVSNQAGDDISFYFMGGSQEINSMAICFTDNCNPTQIFNASFIDNLAVSFGGVNYALSVISIDLSTFGFANNQSLNNFSIDLLAGGYNRLASIDSINSPSPIPLPPAFFLFLSGLAGLGLVYRRKK
ncbi:MAG: VPLPA-CTERM sorting domain-containing protein [Gammaproteobacteria bacterium]|nr:VPLPA-CTERM sorting domain-containing protein [Gammaproteobacteria bacterium]